MSTAGAGPPGASRWREPLAWTAAAAAGAVLVLFSSGRAWATVTFSGGPGGPGAAPVTLAGGDLAPVLGPLALASLAAVVAVPAARGRWRALIGVLMALSGAAIAVAAWRGASSGHVVAVAGEQGTLSGAAAGAIAAVTWVWPVISVAGGLLVLAAGALAVARGARWPGMSDRYERQVSPSGSPRTAARQRPGRAERSLWDALDQGADPTDGPVSR